MTLKELREILDYCREKYGLPYIQLLRKDNRCSRAKLIRRSGSIKRQIILANFWQKHGDEAVVADLLHEIAHHIQRSKHGYMSHDRLFKSLEQELLLDFGMVAKNYTRAYYSRLESINGVCFYEWRK